MPIRNIAVPFAELSLPIGVRRVGGATAPWYLSGGIALASCVAAYQPKGAASLAASYVNLANPGTNDAAPGVAPTFNSATGWTFNGTTQWLTTGITPGNAWTMSVQFANATGSVKSVAGELGANAYFTLFPRNVGHYYYWGGNLAFANPDLANGNMCIAANHGYLNGLPDLDVVSAWTGIPLIIFIGASNNTGPADYLFAGDIIAVSIYNIILSPAQVLAVATAMAAL